MKCPKCQTENPETRKFRRDRAHLEKAEAIFAEIGAEVDLAQTRKLLEAGPM